MRVGARKMALDDPIWPIVPQHSRQMSCIETQRACRYERGKRSGAHQRMHLRQIGDAKMIGLVHGYPFSVPTGQKTNKIGGFVGRSAEI
jgi:hypothetical protein